MTSFTDSVRQAANRSAWDEDGIWAECGDCGCQLVDGPRCRGCDPTAAELDAAERELSATPLPETDRSNEK